MNKEHIIHTHIKQQFQRHSVVLLFTKTIARHTLLRPIMQSAHSLFVLIYL